MYHPVIVRLLSACCGAAMNAFPYIFCLIGDTPVGLTTCLSSQLDRVPTSEPIRLTSSPTESI